MYVSVYVKILISMMDVEKPRRAAREFLANVEEEMEREEEKKRRAEKVSLVISRLTEPCLEQLCKVLEQNRSTLSLHCSLVFFLFLFKC